MSWIKTANVGDKVIFCFSGPGINEVPLNYGDICTISSFIGDRRSDRMIGNLGVVVAEDTGRMYSPMCFKPIQKIPEGMKSIHAILSGDKNIDISSDDDTSDEKEKELEKT